MAKKTKAHILGRHSRRRRANPPAEANSTARAPNRTQRGLVVGCTEHSIQNCRNQWKACTLFHQCTLSVLSIAHVCSTTHCTPRYLVSDYSEHFTPNMYAKNLMSTLYTLDTEAQKCYQPDVLDPFSCHRGHVPAIEWLATGCMQEGQVTVFDKLVQGA